MVSGRAEILDKAVIQSGWWANIGQVTLDDYGEILNCPSAAKLQGNQTLTPTTQDLASMSYSSA